MKTLLYSSALAAILWSADASIASTIILGTNSANQLLLQLDERRQLVSGLPDGPMNFGDAMVRGLSGANGVEVKALGDVTIKCSALSGLTITILEGDSARVRVDQKTRLADVEMGKANRVPVRFDFGDGASAMAGPGSTLRYDLFLNDSYSISGKGSLSAISAEGQKTRIGIQTEPLGGGPLRETIVGNTRRLQRVVPALPVRFSGDNQSGIEVLFADQKISLVRNKQQLLRAANGSELRVVQNEKSVHWQAIKGEFRISTDDVPGWKVLGLTGQSGSLSWDRQKHHATVRNDANEGESRVFLSKGGSVRVGSGGSVEFSRSSTALIVTSISGLVSVLSPEGTEATLQGGHIVLQAGQGTGTIPRQIVNLRWTSGSDLVVEGPLGKASVGLGDVSIKGDQAGELQISSNGKGTAQIRAVDGDFSVRPELLPEGAIALPDGASAQLIFSRGQNILTIQAGPQNRDNLTVALDKAESSQLRPDESITFHLGLGLYTTLPVDVTYYEAAGQKSDGNADGNTARAPAPSTLGAVSSPYLDTSRISQPPVSVDR